MDMIQNDGFDLFMRFADGCRCYLKDRGILSKEDDKVILDYFGSGRRPDQDVIRRVYYVAYPGLEKTSQRMGKGMFDPEVVREFYAFDHNRMKVEQGNYICIAFPAKVLERREREIMVELLPVTGKFWVESDIDTELEPGNYVIVHRINIVEKIPEDYAMRVSEHLKNLGMNKEMKFPKVAIKYLKGLKVCDAGGSEASPESVKEVGDR